jgi:hypothetical protein
MGRHKVTDSPCLHRQTLNGLELSQEVQEFFSAAVEERDNKKTVLDKRFTAATIRPLTPASGEPRGRLANSEDVKALSSGAFRTRRRRRGGDGVLLVVSKPAVATTEYDTGDALQALIPTEDMPTVDEEAVRRTEEMTAASLARIHGGRPEQCRLREETVIPDESPRSGLVALDPLKLQRELAIRFTKAVGECKKETEVRVRKEMDYEHGLALRQMREQHKQSIVLAKRVWTGKMNTHTVEPLEKQVEAWRRYALVMSVLAILGVLGSCAAIAAAIAGGL